jgi:hypothetical protein
MPCHWMTLADGTIVHLNMGRGRPALCQFCRKRPHTKLCDHSLGGSATCDAKICGTCAVHTGPDTDLCPDHAPGVMLPFGGAL